MKITLYEEAANLLSALACQPAWYCNYWNLDGKWSYAYRYLAHRVVLDLEVSVWDWRDRYAEGEARLRDGWTP